MHERDDDIGFFSAVSSKEAEILVVQCADLTIQFSEDLLIEEIYCAAHLDPSRFDHWIGQMLHSIATPDSKAKVDMLLADNSASSSSEGIWRHLNLESRPGESVPLLMKYFVLNDQERETRLICARDLTPMMEIQERFQRELLHLEREREELASLRKGYR